MEKCNNEQSFRSGCLCSISAGPSSYRQHDDDGHGVSCVAVAAGGRFLPFFVVLRTAANQVFPFF